MKNKFGKLIPFLGLIILLLLFTFTSGDKFWTRYNLLAIFNQTVLFMMGGLGMIFVVAQGSIDISQGSTLAISATLTGLAVNAFGIWTIIPVVLLVGVAVGLFNGIAVSKFKVPSITSTLGLLIALRALVALLTAGTVIYIPFELFSLTNFSVLFPIFLVLVIVMGYLFEYTKLGYYARAIGSNEIKANFTGVPVDRIKIISFVMSSVMASIVGVFTLSRIGGVSAQMGNFYELEVLLALFAGGVPVAGGMATRMYKLFIGSLVVGVLGNGLVLNNISGVLSQGIKGIVLILVVFVTIYYRNKQLSGGQPAESTA